MDEHAFGPDAFPLIVAHRGASSTEPENTLASFERALTLGAPVLELDVRLSADRVPVVIHDPDVTRTTGGSGWVHELTFEQLHGLNAGRAEDPQPIPEFHDVLRLVTGRAGLAVEIKNVPGEPAYDPDHEAIVEAVLAEVEVSGFEGPILIISFNPRSIAAAARLAPGIPTGFLFTEALEPAMALAHVMDAGHAFAFPSRRALAAEGGDFVGRAHDAGVRIGTWTVDDRPTLRTMLERGVDAVASNDPATGMAVLSEWRADRG